MKPLTLKYSFIIAIAISLLSYTYIQCISSNHNSNIINSFKDPKADIDLLDVKVTSSRTSTFTQKGTLNGKLMID